LSHNGGCSMFERWQGRSPAPKTKVGAEDKRKRRFLGLRCGVGAGLQNRPLGCLPSCTFKKADLLNRWPPHRLRRTAMQRRCE
jgi:hypothetical protein